MCKVITDQQFNSVSQNAHWAGGLAWVWGSIILFGPHYLPYFVGLAVLLTAWKEFWYDYHDETDEVRGSSFQDFCFYQIGIWGATLAYIVKIRFFV